MRFVAGNADDGRHGDVVRVLERLADGVIAAVGALAGRVQADQSKPVASCRHGMVSNPAGARVVDDRFNLQNALPATTSHTRMDLSLERRLRSLLLSRERIAGEHRRRRGPLIPAGPPVAESHRRMTPSSPAGGELLSIQRSG